MWNLTFWKTENLPLFCRITFKTCTYILTVGMYWSTAVFWQSEYCMVLMLLLDNLQDLSGCCLCWEISARKESKESFSFDNILKAWWKMSERTNTTPFYELSLWDYETIFLVWPLRACYRCDIKILNFLYCPVSVLWLCQPWYSNWDIWVLDNAHGNEGKQTLSMYQIYLIDSLAHFEAFQADI